MTTVELSTEKRLRSHAEKRWQERVPREAMVTLTWSDRIGRAKTARCRCIDISPKGMLAMIPDRLEFRSFIHVHAPALGLVGQATVRHQKPEGLNFVTGLEFVGGLMFRRD